MRSLFWKGMLAFLTVILVAVGTVALLVGRTTETEFRRYALEHGGTWNRQALELATYYADHGSWDGVQEVLQALPDLGGSRGRGRGSGATGRASLEFRLADLERQIVGDTRGVPNGTVSQAELDRGIPIEANGQVVGYLLPSTQTLVALPLDAPQAEFLARIRTTLWIAALTALAAALVVGGLLFRSIVAPLRRLTTASQSIAAGDLSAHAPVQGRDEVAQLADAFNRMTESLARAEKARRNQTADIAHELRTPLTVLQGSLEAMLDGVYPADREELMAASAQVRTLARLVEDLRLLALADAGQLRLHTAPLGLAAFLEEIVEAHRLPAQEQGVDLALETLPILPSVLADRDRLAQVMGNLLGNALRYVPRGGHIAVRVTEQGQEVVVAIADDGPGVPAEDLPHLFERFWRGDPGRRQATGGSGLGLAIARHIVEAHGGRIWADLTPGSGLTVAFTLPAAHVR
jgi:two-component system sensor histidine kinase BaeS